MTEYRQEKIASSVDQRDDLEAQSTCNPSESEKYLNVLSTKISRDDGMDCDRSLSIPSRLVARKSTISVRSLPNLTSQPRRIKKQIPPPNLILPLETKRLPNKDSTCESPKAGNPPELQTPSKAVHDHDCQSTVSVSSRTERSVNDVISTIKRIRSKLDNSKDTILRLEEKSQSILRDDYSLSSTKSSTYKQENKCNNDIPSANRVLERTKSNGSVDKELTLKNLCDKWDALSQTEADNESNVATNDEAEKLSASSQKSESMKAVVAKNSSSSMKGTTSVILREAHKLSLAISGAESFRDSDLQETGNKSESSLVRSPKICEETRKDKPCPLKICEETKKDKPCSKGHELSLQVSNEHISCYHKLSRETSSASADASFLQYPAGSRLATEVTDIQSTSRLDSKERVKGTLPALSTGGFDSLSPTSSTKSTHSHHLPSEIKHCSSRQSRVPHSPSLNSRRSQNSGKMSMKSRVSHNSKATLKSTVCDIRSAASNKSRHSEVLNSPETLKIILKDLKHATSKCSKLKSETGHLHDSSKGSTTIQPPSSNDMSPCRVSDGDCYSDLSVKSSRCDSQMMAENIAMTRSNHSGQKDAILKSSDSGQHSIPVMQAGASESATLENQINDSMIAGASSKVASADSLREVHDKPTTFENKAESDCTKSVELRSKHSGIENNFVCKEMKNAKSIMRKNENAVVPQCPAHGSRAAKYSSKLLRRTKSLPVVMHVSKPPLAVVEEHKACIYDGSTTSFCIDEVEKIGARSTFVQNEGNGQPQQDLNAESQSDVFGSILLTNEKIGSAEHGTQTNKKRKGLWGRIRKSSPSDTVSFDREHATKHRAGVMNDFYKQDMLVQSTERFSDSLLNSSQTEEPEIGKEYKTQADKLLFQWNHASPLRKSKGKLRIHNPFKPKRLTNSNGAHAKEVNSLESKQNSKDQYGNAEKDHLEEAAKESKDTLKTSMTNAFSQLASSGTKAPSLDVNNLIQKRQGKTKRKSMKTFWYLRQKAVVACDSSEMEERSLLDENRTDEENAMNMKLREDSYAQHVNGKKTIRKYPILNIGKNRKVKNKTQSPLIDQKKIHFLFQSKANKYEKNIEEQCEKEIATHEQSEKDVVTNTSRFINAKKKIWKALQRSPGSSTENTHEETDSKMATHSMSGVNHDALQEYLQTNLVVRCENLEEVEVFEKGLDDEESELFLGCDSSKDMDCQKETPLESDKCLDSLGTESFCKSKQGFVVTRDDATHTNTTISSLTARSLQDLVTRLVKIQSQLKKSGGLAVDRARALRENAMLAPGKCKEDESHANFSIFSQAEINHAKSECPLGSSKAEERSVRHAGERADRSYYSGYTGDYSSDILRVVQSDSSTVASSGSESQYKALDRFNCACG